MGHHAEEWDLTQLRQKLNIGFLGEALTTTDGGVEHKTGDLQAVCVGLADGQQGVIDGAEAEAGDDYYRKFQGFGEIGYEIVIADRNEESAGAFDENYIVTHGQLLVRAEDLAEVDAFALDFCGDARRERAPKINGIDRVERLLMIH